VSDKDTPRVDTQLPRPCKICGKPVPKSAGKYPGRPRTYCSEGCREAKRKIDYQKIYRVVKSSRGKVKKCRLCGKKFEPSHGNSVYCSEECRGEGFLKNRKKWVDARKQYQEESRRKKEEKDAARRARSASTPPVPIRLQARYYREGDRRPLATAV
jgi:predicted nucleic acid-binding Zn ribbon protein